MNIIFGRDTAAQLRERHIVLELEVLDAGGKPLECFCLVDGTSIPTSELATLRHAVQLHDKLIENLGRENWPVCRDLIEHLQGRFGGELDSFYATILERTKPAV
jgi:hypothetical protein